VGTMVVGIKVTVGSCVETAAVLGVACAGATARIGVAGTTAAENSGSSRPSSICIPVRTTTATVITMNSNSRIRNLRTDPAGWESCATAPPIAVAAASCEPLRQPRYSLRKHHKCCNAPSPLHPASEAGAGDRCARSTRAVTLTKSRILILPQAPGCRSSHPITSYAAHEAAEPVRLVTIRRSFHQHEKGVSCAIRYGVIEQREMSE
jgi:hypothetical protein